MQKTKKYILLDSIRSCQNVWAIMRTCDWAWFDRIYLTWFTPTPPRKDISKTAIWAENYVDWEFYKDPMYIIGKLKSLNVMIIALEQDERSIDIRKLEIPERDICIVLWNDIEWVKKDIINVADVTVEIPMLWKKKSLNVATSAWILMYKMI